jgi:hypothetical protein
MLNQVVRHAAVAALVEEVASATLLDVGSGSGGIAAWVHGNRSVTCVDQSFDDYGAQDETAAPAGVRRVRADARHLPFADRSFDLVVAVDLMEHVPPADRAQVVEELLRVSRRRLILACPTGRRALAADQRLWLHLTDRGQDLQGTWLAEHVRNGFPDRDELAKALTSHGRLQIVGNENLRSHEVLMRAEATRIGRRTSAAVAGWLQGAWQQSGWRRRAADRTASALRLHDRPPTYRSIFVLDLRGETGATQNSGR